MRTDRLLAETLYLIRHGRVTARTLASHFEVSPRTVLRDMEALCMAGVPILSFEGATGGYELDESYRLDPSFVDKNDLPLLCTALEALSSAVKDEKLRFLLEKFRALSAESGSLTVDLSALREDERLQQTLLVLRGAIRRRHAVRMQYTNAEGLCAEHTVEPISLEYRWYSWYLRAYSRVKDSVLTYKAVRMENVTETEELCAEHTDTAPLQDDRPTVTLLIRCRECARIPLIEYLHARPDRKLPDGDWLLQATLPAQERFWRGALLSLGDDAEILSPKEIRAEFHDLAQNILQLYPSEP